MAWAKERLSAKDMARIQAVDEGYRRTANAIGLMRMNTAAADERLLMIREVMKERREEIADPEEEQRFMGRALAPLGGRWRASR